MQQSYNQMLDRLLLYKQSTQSADTSLIALNSYLLNPDEKQGELFSLSRNQVEEHQQQFVELAAASLPSSVITSYSQMLDTFLEQTQAAFDMTAAYSSNASFVHYEKAEKTASFIREDSQQLVDMELSIYEPINKQVQAEHNRMYYLGAAVFITNTLMSILLAIWISRSITLPVSRLVSRARQISKGNLQQSAHPQLAADELGILSNAFEQMSSDLFLLIEKDKESLEKDRLVKELELQALQSQINPHFLFNTLNALSKLALLEGAEKTSDLIVSMSNLLRYNLRNLEHPVSLHDEVEHVKEYVIIQQARFRDRVRFELDFDPLALQQQIPALTLQPLVENAFVHGIEHMESGAKIRMQIKQDANYVRIILMDNGIGMSEEVRAALLRLDLVSNHKQSTGLGTKNVFKRLQLFYGQIGLVEIDSSAGQGTKITISIPLGEEGEHKNVPTIDRR